MHINNALYPLWATEALDHAYRNDHLPCEIEVSFKKEGHLDEDVIISSQIDELKTLHSIKSSVDNRELSRIRINWIKI